jgi:mono/diheme cytochrome c family protein
MRLKFLVLAGLLISWVGLVYGFDVRDFRSRRTGYDAQESAAIFKNRCAKCHLADGKGKESYTPDFTDAKWQATKKDEELTASITDGLNDMPAFGDILSKDQIKGMVVYVRSLAKSGNNH